jgi:hypothetical protein
MEHRRARVASMSWQAVVKTAWQRVESVLNAANTGLQKSQSPEQTPAEAITP